MILMVFKRNLVVQQSLGHPEYYTGKGCPDYQALRTTEGKLRGIHTENRHSQLNCFKVFKV